MHYMFYEKSLIINICFFFSKMESGLRYKLYAAKDLACIKNIENIQKHLHICINLHIFASE